MAFHPYPRMLYKGDEHLIVQDELGEAEARKQGWGNPRPDSTGIDWHS